MLLFVEPPDRLHGEIVSPLGTTEAIVDAGAGRLAIAVPRERAAYCGASDPDALARLLGIRVSVADLVSGLLRGEATATDLTVTRQPAGQSGLPRSFELSGPGGRLRLRLRSIEPVSGSRADELGTGRAPDGFEVRPLDELRFESVR